MKTATYQYEFSCVASEDLADRMPFRKLRTAKGFALHAELAVSVAQQLLCPSNPRSYCYQTTCMNLPKSIFVRLLCWLARKSVERRQPQVTLTGPTVSLASEESWYIRISSGKVVKWLGESAWHDVHSAIKSINMRQAKAREFLVQFVQSQQAIRNGKLIHDEKSP